MTSNRILEIQKWTTLVLLFSLLSLSMKSQTILFEIDTPTPEVELGYGVLESPDGSLILFGLTNADTEGLADIMVSKMTPGGDEIWTVTHGGFNNDFPNGGVMLSDGSFVIVGTTGSFTSTPSRDVYVLKMDTDGNILWTESYGGGGTDEGTGIRLTEEGDFIISANTESYGAGGTDGWLFKIDGEGNLLWDQTFGGSDADNIAEVELSPDGGYILTGGTVSFGADNQEDLWLIKTDAEGNEIWTQTFGVADGVDAGRDVAATTDGYVVVGIHDNDPDIPAPISGEAYFIKVDFNGNLVWDQSIPGVFRVEGFSVYPAEEEGWIIAGTKVLSPSEAVFWVAKTDAQGEVIWEVESGQPGTISFALDVIETANGDVVATGFSGFTQNSTEDIHLLRLTESTVSVSEEFYSISLSAMPNPTDGYFKVVFGENHTGGTLRLINGAGQTVQLERFGTQDMMELDVSNLPAGIYIVHIETTEGVGQTKLIKN